MVLASPASEFVASFVGVETILAGKVIKKDRGTFVASVSGQEIEPSAMLIWGNRLSSVFGQNT
jgi:ABC-type Fe3+/spermidine/putrescine transport system ATPase subunit